jgi:glycerol kinase
LSPPEGGSAIAYGKGRAALESVCFQTLDLVDAMRADCGDMADTVLRVDGGMVASDWTM